jgi:uncharacterized protein (UPF0276 family)
MARVWLAASGGSEVLAALTSAPAVSVDRLKVGSWQSDAELIVAAAFRPVLLHVSEGVCWPRSPWWINRSVRQTAWLRTPWVSCHLELGWMSMDRPRPAPQLIPRDVGRRLAVHTASRWAARSPVPVLLENMPRSQPSPHDYLVDPAFVSQVVRESGCHLLADLAHARISAAMRNEPVRDYLQELPLDRVMEVHLSGPRPLVIAPELLQDSHDTLQAEDYALLDWLLDRCRPRAVTLEYWRQPAAVVEQLQRLRQMADRRA